MNFITIILKNLLRRRIRTSLTCAGVAVAIGSMVTLVGVSDGFGKANEDVFSKRGVDIVVVEGGKPNQFASDLDMELLDQIRATKGVKDAAGALVEFLSTKNAGGNDLSVVVFGWMPGTFQFDTLTFEKGRPFAKGETKVAIVGSVMAKNLRKDVGDNIELLDEQFKIVGVFNTFNVLENGGIVLPLAEMQRLLLRPNSASGFAVRLDHKEDIKIDTICQQIEKLKSKRNNVKMQAKPTEEYISSSIHIQVMRVAAWLTALIAVVSGTISTLNTMSMSVFERFREIGTLRAIGWSKGRIIRMVMGEAVLLGLGGALLGIGTSIILLQVLAHLPETSGFIDGSLAPFVIVEGLLVAVSVGILGGIAPAYRATRLLPTEALRYE